MTDPGVPEPRRKVLVALPAFNEKQSLPRVVAAVRRAAPDAAIVVVDDGSTDGTAGVARQAGIPVLRLP
ncbi:MAG: glycosyltransferase, partial [Candidatus Nanopelagicales bacterium]